MHYSLKEGITEVHYSFDGPDPVKQVTRFGSSASPVPNRTYDGEFFSTTPENAFYLVQDGGGAEGSRGYLALPGSDSDQFYVESTPVWWTPTTTFDLRDTEASFYLKELTEITVADGYAPYLFIAAYIEDTKYLTCWRQLRQVLIGQGEWAFNRVVLEEDDAQWLCYGCSHPDARPGLDYVLSHCGFLGIMYQKGSEFRQVHATGLLGLDELRYNIPLKKS